MRESLECTVGGELKSEREDQALADELVGGIRRGSTRVVGHKRIDRRVNQGLANTNMHRSNLLVPASVAARLISTRLAPWCRVVATLS